jgi:hypothetical protein
MGQDIAQWRTSSRVVQVREVLGVSEFAIDFRLSYDCVDGLAGIVRSQVGQGGLNTGPAGGDQLPIVYGPAQDHRYSGSFNGAPEHVRTVCFFYCLHECISACRMESANVTAPRGNMERVALASYREATAFATIDTPQPRQYHPSVITRRDTQPGQTPADSCTGMLLPVARRRASGGSDHDKRSAMQMTIAAQVAKAMD